MQEKDFDWFIENYDDLFNTYGCCYIGIKNEKVIGTYKTAKEAINEISNVEPLGTFIVQYCNGSDSAYTAKIASMNFMG